MKRYQYRDDNEEDEQQAGGNHEDVGNIVVNSLGFTEKLPDFGFFSTLNPCAHFLASFFSAVCETSSHPACLRCGWPLFKSSATFYK